MPGVYDSMITRADAAPLIPTAEVGEILKVLPQSSAAMQLLRSVRMTTKSLTQPVLGSFPLAYWVNGDTGLKQTTEVNWTGISMTAEEIAVIVAIPEAVLADSQYPIWSEVRPYLAEAIGIKLDQAIFAGVEKPVTWPAAIIPSAVTAGNEVTAGSTPAEGGLANDLALAMDQVEGDGYDVTGFAAKRSLRGQLRRARDTTGQRILDASAAEIEGVPVAYVPPGVFDATTLAVTGDWSMAILGVRQDLTWKILDQAVITDDTGKVILNLPQQDSVGLRVVARFGYALAAPITRVEPENATTPFPFSVLHPAVAGP